MAVWLVALVGLVALSRVPEVLDAILGRVALRGDGAAGTRTCPGADVRAAGDR